MFEEDIEALELEIAQAREMRDRHEDKEIDIQIAINYCKYFVKFLHELILSGSDNLKNAAMFGLHFNSSPTYEELKNGRTTLASIFELNEVYANTKSRSVTPLEFESKFPE